MNNSLIMDQSSKLFEASTSEIAHVTAVLGAIYLAKQGRIYIGPDGVIITIVAGQSVKISATFDKELFDKYLFEFEADEPSDDNLTEAEPLENVLTQQLRMIRKAAAKTVCVNVDLSGIVDCFNIATAGSNDTKCSISYDCIGSLFVVAFIDSLMTERCEFSTFVDEDSADGQQLQLDSEAVVMEVTMSAAVIYDALVHLKDINSDEVYIYASNSRSSQRNLYNEQLEENKLMVVSKGEIGYASFVFPVEDLVLRKYNQRRQEYEVVKDEFMISIYQFDMLRKIMRSVKLSSKIRLRKDNKGVMSIHLLTKHSVEKKTATYGGTIIEYVLMELTVDDEGTLVNREELMELIRHAENKPGKAKRQKKPVPQGPDILNMLHSKPLTSLNAIMHELNQEQEEEHDGTSVTEKRPGQDLSLFF